MHITKANIFKHCINDKQANNVYYCINDCMVGNSMLVLGIVDDKILTYTNDWLHLIKANYPHNPTYLHIANFYNDMDRKLTLGGTMVDNIGDIAIANAGFVYVPHNVIPFITSYSTGTAHGYSGLFSILISYIKNIKKYVNHKIAIYTNSQKGILQIIQHFASINIINPNNIIYLDSNIIYKFAAITIIPNMHYSFHGIEHDMADLIDKYVMNCDNGGEYSGRDNSETNDGAIAGAITGVICVIKSMRSVNVTFTGANVLYEDVLEYARTNGYTNIEPTDYNEIEFIKIMQNCTRVVLSWGTAFFKNYIYISDKCSSITVIVVPAYYYHYRVAVSTKTLFTKFKNAEIDYVMVTNKLIHIKV